MTYGKNGNVEEEIDNQPRIKQLVGSANKCGYCGKYCGKYCGNIVEILWEYCRKDYGKDCGKYCADIVEKTS